MRKNVLIITLAILSGSAIIYSYSTSEDLNEQKKLTVRYSATVDSLRTKLTKVNGQIEASYKQAEQLYLKALKETEEARKKLK